MSRPGAERPAWPAPAPRALGNVDDGSHDDDVTMGDGDCRGARRGSPWHVDRQRTVGTGHVTTFGPDRSVAPGWERAGALDEGTVGFGVRQHTCV